MQNFSEQDFKWTHPSHPLENYMTIAYGKDAVANSISVINIFYTIHENCFVTLYIPTEKHMFIKVQ